MNTQDYHLYKPTILHYPTLCNKNMTFSSIFYHFRPKSPTKKMLYLPSQPRGSRRAGQGASINSAVRIGADCLPFLYEPGEHVSRVRLEHTKTVNCPIHSMQTFIEAPCPARRLPRRLHAFKPTTSYHYPILSLQNSGISPANPQSSSSLFLPPPHPV